MWSNEENLLSRRKEKGKLNQALEEFERNFIISTMEAQGWNRKKTAQELGIPLSTLKYKMRKLGIYGSVPRRRNIPKGG